MGMFKRIALAALVAVCFASLSHAADTVVSTTTRNAGGSYGGVYQFVFGNASDGTGESMVLKVSSATLSGTPTRLKITELRWSTYGMSVLVAFDGTNKSTATILSGNGHLSEKETGSLMDPWVAGHTGNIYFSTLGASAGDGYTVYLKAEKVQ